MIKNFDYSITGSPKVDEIFEFLSGNSEKDAEKFKFSIGEYVYVETDGKGGSPILGTIAQIRGRRNGYPEPFFIGHWFPLYWLEHIDGNTGGGDIHEECVRLATEDEVEVAKRKANND